MEVLSVKENKDGSIDLTIEITEREQQLILEFGIKEMLKQQIKNMKKICFDCGQEIDHDTILEYPDTEICGDCLKGE